MVEHSLKVVWVGQASVHGGVSVYKFTFRIGVVISTVQTGIKSLCNLLK